MPFTSSNDLNAKVAALVKEMGLHSVQATRVLMEFPGRRYNLTRTRRTIRICCGSKYKIGHDHRNVRVSHFGDNGA
jgi:hypothetical protein